MANLRYQFLSSSLLKEILELGGNLDDMMPANVSAALKKKLLP
jgi:pantetheine-phosphate adenylyltransferase